MKIALIVALAYTILLVLLYDETGGLAILWWLLVIGPVVLVSWWAWKFWQHCIDTIVNQP